VEGVRHNGPTNLTNVVMLTGINPAAVDFAWGGGKLGTKKLPQTPAQRMISSAWTSEGIAAPRLSNHCFFSST
jgi:hypothetical protein